MALAAVQTRVAAVTGGSNGDGDTGKVKRYS